MQSISMFSLPSMAKTKKHCSERGTILESLLKDFNRESTRQLGIKEFAIKMSKQKTDQLYVIQSEIRDRKNRYEKVGGYIGAHFIRFVK